MDRWAYEIEYEVFLLGGWFPRTAGMASLDMAAAFALRLSNDSNLRDVVLVDVERGERWVAKDGRFVPEPRGDSLPTSAGTP